MAASHECPSWSIITSLRYDEQLQSAISSQLPSVYYMLPYHRDRMVAAAVDFGWEEARRALTGPDGLSHLTKALDNYMNLGDTVQKGKSYKLRVLLKTDGQLTVSSSEVPAVTVKGLFPTYLPDCSISEVPLTWPIYISRVRTATSLHTKHKTTNRSVYDEAWKQTSAACESSFPGRAAEILLVNEQDEITEGSFTTPYFYRGETWITPPESAGGNLGTTRRWALEKGLCIEKTIKKAEIMEGEIVWLSNGVRGWALGAVVQL